MFGSDNDIKMALKTASFKTESHISLIMDQYGYNVNERLFQSMNYAVFSGGKRLRPFLTLASCDIFGIDEVAALNIAAAIEFVHTYSLIHDDLPAMDDDDYRRGKESCHKKFDEATAILAGDALQSLAFEIMLSKSTHSDPTVRCELSKSLARSIGMNGMAGGQMIDILHKNKELNVDGLTRMNRMKTGELFSFCCEASAIVSHSKKNIRLALRGYALSIGLAYQILDDMEDWTIEANDNKEKNVKNGNNYLSSMDKDMARQQVYLLIEQAKTHLSIIGDRANLLKEFADYIINK